MEILVRLIHCHSATRRKFYKVDTYLGIQLKVGLFENSNVQLCSLSDLMTIIRTSYFDSMLSTAALRCFLDTIRASIR
jgi:hypothetical protein